MRLGIGLHQNFYDKKLPELPTLSGHKKHPQTKIKLSGPSGAFGGQESDVLPDEEFDLLANAIKGSEHPALDEGAESVQADVAAVEGVTTDLSGSAAPASASSEHEQDDPVDLYN
jgi:hypothetical protein